MQKIVKIEPVTVEEYNVHVINSIKAKYPKLRQKSKAPSFALTYEGTWKTLVENCDIPQDEAKEIEKAYHDLYKVSDEYSKQRIDKAAKDGYAKVAFDLKVRCNRLKLSFLNSKITPQETIKEQRTLNNAFGQSYGMLLLRALNEFSEEIRNSPFKYSVFPVNMIHDCLYLVIRDDLETVNFVNKYLVKAIRWQEDPAIKHDKVHLEGELSIFYPTWANELVLPNNASLDDLITLADNYIKEL